jgi:hypothetical protein
MMKTKWIPLRGRFLEGYVNDNRKRQTSHDHGLYQLFSKRMEQQGTLTDIWRSITGVVMAKTRLQNQWKKDDTKYTIHM